jgi:hypothetical protein
VTTQVGPANGVDRAICSQCRDLWSWMVVYRDGSAVYECQGESAPHAAWKDVNDRLVAGLALIPRQAGLQQVVVHVPEGAVPVLFRRRQIELNMASGEQTGRQTIHCLGWEGFHNASYVFIFQDGSTLLTSDRNAV